MDMLARELHDAKQRIDARRSQLANATVLDEFMLRYARDLAASQPRCDYTIAQLPTLGNVATTDLVPIYHNGQTYAAQANVLTAVSPISPTVFNVIAYGAKGNGSTDDTVAVANAISAAGVSGGRVFFPPGTYLIATSTTHPVSGVYGLAIPSNVMLYGAGAGVSILKQGFASSGQGNARLLTNTNPVTGGNSFIAIADLQLLTNAPSGVSPNLTTYDLAYQFYGVQNVVVERCAIINGMLSSNPLSTYANTTSVHTTGKNNRALIRGNYFSNGAEALAIVQGTDFVVTDNLCLGSYDSSISINSSGERHIISNNDINKLGVTYAALACIEATNDGSGDANGIRDITITGNACLNNGYYDGIQLNGPVTNCTVTGNDCRGSARNGIYASGFSSGTISGNSCCGNTSNGIWFVNDKNTTSVVISGNTCSSNGNIGIRFGGGAGATTALTCSQNVCYGNTSYGIALGITVTAGLCANNTCNNNTAGNVSTTASSGWIIRGNIGLNPIGSIATPSVPASTTPYTNTTQYDLRIFLFTGGGVTVSAIAIGGNNTSLTMAASSQLSFTLAAGESVTLTYAGGTPTWTFFAV